MEDEEKKTNGGIWPRNLLIVMQVLYRCTTTKGFWVNFL